MKATILTITGAVGSGIAYLFGGWNLAIETLLIFMLIDYVSGLIVAGIFHKSTKTDSGALSSQKCWQGLFKKCMTLVFVLVGYRLDLVTGSGSTYIRDAICISFLVNETISIIENGKLMGIPIPAALDKAIDLLNNRKGVSGS